MIQLLKVMMINYLKFSSLRKIYNIFQNMLSNRNQVFNLQTPVQMISQPNVMEQSDPQLLCNGKPQTQSSKESAKSIESEHEDANSRKNQPLFVYFLNLVISFCISFQNILLIFTQDQQAKGYMSIAVALSTIFISLLTTYLLCKDKLKILNLYMLMDNIFLTQVASAFGFIGFLMVIYCGNWYEVLTMVAFPIQIIFFVGNFRVMMLHVKWSKWRVILFKLVLLADSAVFFQIGAHYITVRYEYTGGENPEIDSKAMDFVLLYIFGLFALFVQLYSKMCDIDQTSELRFDYELKEMEEVKKIERIRKSVIGIDRDIEKVKANIFNRISQKKSFLEVQQMLNL